MSALEKVYGVTEQLFQLVSQPIAKEARDESIQKITSLLDHRDQLLTDVHPPFAANEKQLFQQIVTWNEGITKRFSEIKQQIQQDMMQLKKTKTSNQQYVNPYQDVSTTDGMYYDKRK
ncbi:MAG: flagellar protein FliT [Bacillota bacterium]